MATTYNGSAYGVQTPAGTPQAGRTPALVLPADGDPLNAASVAQAYKAIGDYMAYVQASVRLLPPETPIAGGSMFTTVTYVAFGGTVTPSTNTFPASISNSRFVVQIQTGGAVGVATYVISADGGATYSAVPQTTGASVVDTNTGIILAFAGTLTAAGTASFRWTYSPMAQWSIQAGTGRYQIDHNGLPTGGRVSQLEENWLIAPGAGSPWTTNLGAGAAVALGIVGGYDGSFLQFTPSTASGSSNYDVITTTPLMIPNTVTTSFVLQFEFGLNTAAAGVASNTSWFLGLGSGVSPFVDTSEILLYKKYNVSTFQLLTGNGSTQTVAPTNPALGPTTGFAYPIDRFRIEVHGANTQYGAYTAVFVMNDLVIGTVAAANLPGATGLRLVFGANSEGGVPAGSPLGFLGNVRAVWNRYQVSLL